MTDSFILAIDQGTTGSTVLVLDVADRRNPIVVGKQTCEFKQYYPQSGWVEHDLEDIWQSVAQAVTGACERAAAASCGFKLASLAAIGITNQRETICTFDRNTGRALLKAIVWQDKRSSGICNELKDREPYLREKTGLVFDPYFSGTKISWILRHHPEIGKAVASGRAVFGTIDTFLLHRLTGGKSYYTEPSNASRTQLYSAVSGAYDGEIADWLGLPHLDCLPEVRDSAGLFGKTSGLGFLPDDIPITGILGDQQAALAGQTCFEVGEAKCTYGTGAFMLLNTGDRFQLSNAGLLSTVAWGLAGKRTFALEGSAFVAGAAVQFLRDQLGLLPDASASEALAQSEVAAPEVYFIPALAGLGAPYWDASARGAFLGLTRGTSKGQLVRAALEGIGFAVNDLYEAMIQDFPSAAQARRTIRVDGGAAANNLLMQFQADISHAAVDRPRIIETTAFGAALFAGLGVGMYESLADLRHMRAIDGIFEPQLSLDADLRQQQLAGWRRGIKAVQAFHG